MSKKVYVKWDKEPEEDDYVLFKGKIRKVNRIETTYMSGQKITYINLHGMRECKFTIPEFVQVMRKLEPGDKVKVVDAVSSHRWYKNGDILTFEKSHNYPWSSFYVKECPIPLFNYEVEYYEEPKVKHFVVNDTDRLNRFNEAFVGISNHIRRVQMRSEVAEMLVEVLDGGGERRASIFSNLENNNTRIITESWIVESYKSPNDDWDTLTGVYVALCKATGKKPVLAC